MYKNIEKSYKEVNSECKFNRYYWKCVLILAPIIIIFALLGIHNMILLLISILILIFFVVKYEITNYKSYKSTHIKGQKLREKLQIILIR